MTGPMFLLVMRLWLPYVVKTALFSVGLSYLASAALS
jgi:hypothetical protein